jgi:dolichol-phosphate mannosyltransferase
MWTLAKKARYFIDAFVAFSYVPLRAASLLGFLACLGSAAYAAFIVLSRLLWSRDVPGWGSLMVVVLMTSGLQLLMTGVLGEYVWRNLDEARRRPRYVVDRVETTGVADAAEHRGGHSVHDEPAFPAERAA